MLTDSVDLRGFEPLTSSMRTRRATNCATGPDNSSTLSRDFPLPRLGRPPGRAAFRSRRDVGAGAGSCKVARPKPAERRCY